MSGTTSVPAIEWTLTGLILPTESVILAGVQADYDAAFGGNLNPALNTPQGQLETSTAAVIANANSALAELVNQVDPDNATGFMQDAIARIYFLNRNPALPTTVQLLCTGGAGTKIPVGAQAQDTSGNIYVCTQAGTIGSGGTVLLNFANQQTGPIACPATTVTRIYQAIPGWDTVTNPNPGTVGQDVETSASFEFRRQQSVAANAHGSLASIYGAVIEVPGVLDAFVVENVTDNAINGAIVVNGVTVNPNSTGFNVVAHSLYVAVTGGAAADIANAIWTKKNDGSNMNGNTTETVTDTSYSFPQPQYAITYETPVPTQYSFIVNIVATSALPGDITTLVQQAITAQFNGTNANGQRVRIGSLLLAAPFYGPVAQCAGPSVPVQVLSIFLGSAFSGDGTLVNGSKVLTVTSVVSGRLTPGTVVSDAASAIPNGTTIVKQITAVAPPFPTGGGTGTYLMSEAATINEPAPEVIAGVGGTAQQIGIDQQPQVGTIVVNLI